MNVTERVVTDFDQKGRTWPSPEEATLWLATEVGEAAEQILMMLDKWVRNNPDKNDPQQIALKYNRNELAKELADVIYMALITGVTLGIDPMEALMEVLNE